MACSQTPLGTVQKIPVRMEAPACQVWTPTAVTATQGSKADAVSLVSWGPLSPVGTTGAYASRHLSQQAVLGLLEWVCHKDLKPQDARTGAQPQCPRLLNTQVGIFRGSESLGLSPPRSCPDKQRFWGQPESKGHGTPHSQRWVQGALCFGGQTWR